MKTNAPPPPVYQAPQPDPALEAQAKQASADNVLALQERAQGDTASLMARYGAIMAMTGSGK